MKKQSWNEKWKPELAILQKQEMDRYSKTTSEIFKNPIHDGKYVYATNGHIMAVYPSNKKVGVKYKKGKMPDVHGVIPESKGRMRFAFNPIYLQRLIKSLGHQNDKAGVIFDIDPKNPKAIIRVEVRKDTGESSKAFGLLMPMQHIGEELS